MLGSKENRFDHLAGSVRGILHYFTRRVNHHHIPIRGRICSPWREAFRIRTSRCGDCGPSAADSLSQRENIRPATRELLHKRVAYVIEDKWHFDRVWRAELALEDRRLPVEFVNKRRCFPEGGATFGYFGGERYRGIS